MIFTHKSNGSEYVQVAFKWQGSRRYFSFGNKSDLNLSAAEKYMNKVRQIRLECKAKRMAFPVDPPRPEKAPSINKLIVKHQNFIRTSDSVPMGLLFQIVDRAHELKMTQDEYLKFVEQCITNYKQQIAEQKAKTAAAVKKRKATIAAKKAKLNNTSNAA